MAMRAVGLTGSLLTMAAVAGCAASPALYRLDAYALPFPGLGGGMRAEAMRTPEGWTVTQTTIARRPRSSTRRLSVDDGVALDVALASPRLYEPPVPINEGCIDPDSVSLEVEATGVRRKLFLSCSESPGMDAVLGILFETENSPH